MHSKTSAQRGYSLIEALVVIAIIGVISMVTVPNFMAMQRSMKVKSAIRSLTNDLRAARQQAVSTYRPVMISFGTTPAERHSYWIYQWDPSLSPPAWTVRPPGERFLEPQTSPENRTVYFTNIGFPDVDSFGGTNRPDVIFETSGGIRQPPADPTLRVRTDANITKPEYIVTVSPSGSVKVQ